jgi:hypothetical protein
MAVLQPQRMTLIGRSGEFVNVRFMVRQSAKRWLD